MPYSLICAIDKLGGIGKSNTDNMAWYIPEDLQHFKNKTKNNIIIMGRKTWESLSCKPLKNRLNYIISRTLIMDNLPDNVVLFNSVEECLIYFDKNKKNFINKEKFVIGGAEIYKEFLKRKLINYIYLTYINNSYECDILMPELLKIYNNESNEWNKSLDLFNQDTITFLRKIEYNTDITYNEYKFINTAENEFLNLMKYILENGNDKSDRTGVGTLSLFGPQLRFSLRDGIFPLLTTRKMALRQIFEELIWFLRGQTDSKILEQKNVNVWKPNTTRQFLDTRGLTHLNEGDMGASYSFQFRHYGADYKGFNEVYYDCGFDQIKYVLNLLKNEPDSRRILINLWNPPHLDNMALPPCFVPDTLIKTNKGYKEIQDIAKNDLVLTSDGEYHAIIENNYKEYKGDILHITSINGSIIKTTPDHEFLVYNNKSKQTEWVKARQLNNNIHYLAQNKNNKSKIPEFVITTKYKKNKFIEVINKIFNWFWCKNNKPIYKDKTFKVGKYTFIKYQINNNIEKTYFKFNEPVYWKLLGLVYMRYNIYNKSKNAHVDLSHNNTRLNSIFDELFSEKDKLYYKIYTDDEEIIEYINLFDAKKISNKITNDVYYVFKSYIWDSIFKSIKNGLPEWVYNAPSVYIRYFLNGCGIILENTKAIQFNYHFVKNTKKLYELQTLLNKLDIYNFELLCNNDNLKINDPNSIKVDDNYIFNINKNINNTEYENDVLYIKNDLKYIFHKIKDIRTVNYEGKIYDLTIKDNHSYSVYNYVVHNCGFCYQFYVYNGELSCKITQRSSDIMLAGGWNIASASLFTIIMANMCGYKPGEIIWSLGDCHLYKNQLEEVKQQIKRLPVNFPNLLVNNIRENIEDYEFTDFKLVDYNPQDKISIKFNV